MRFIEHFKRSLVKTITYRVFIIISTFAITYIWTGKIDLALGITSVATIVNTIIYYIHERIWNKIYWGKKKR